MPAKVEITTTIKVTSYDEDFRVVENSPKYVRVLANCLFTVASGIDDDMILSEDVTAIIYGLARDLENTLEPQDEED